jgi:outer membrane protein assembly factor BamB
MGWRLERTLLLVALLAMASVGVAGAADWPKWRGPNGDGISLDTGLLKDWPQGGPPVVWQIDALGEGYSGVAVSGGVLYAHGNVGGVEKAMAFKEADGSPLWAVQTHAGPGYTHGVGNGPRGTPTVADGRVYVEGGWGDVWCLDAKTGAAVWNVDMVKQFGGQVPGWGYSESPLVYGDLLIVTPGGRAGSVVALNKDTGAPVWRTDQAPSAAEYSSPVAATIGGIPQIVQFVKDGVFGMTVDAGRLLWSYRHQKAQNSINITTPIVANDCVLISSAYGNGTGLARIATTGGQQIAEE